MATTTPTTWTEDTVATELLGCEAERRDRTRFTDEWPELDVATGYRIQHETLRRRLARGERVVGVKLGLTSLAKQARMGVDTPFVAWLTDAMVLQPGGEVIDSRYRDFTFRAGDVLADDASSGAYLVGRCREVAGGHRPGRRDRRGRRRHRHRSARDPVRNKMFGHTN